MEWLLHDPDDTTGIPAGEPRAADQRLRRRRHAVGGALSRRVERVVVDPLLRVPLLPPRRSARLPAGGAGGTGGCSSSPSPRRWWRGRASTPGGPAHTATWSCWPGCCRRSSAAPSCGCSPGGCRCGRRSPWPLSSSAAVLVVAVDHWGAQAAAPLIAYVLLWLSTVLPSPRLARRHDISYGVYIYAFPVQQLLAYAGAHAPRAGRLRRPGRARHRGAGGGQLVAGRTPGASLGATPVPFPATVFSPG